MNRRITLWNRSGFVYIVWLISFVVGLMISVNSKAFNTPLHSGDIFMPPTFAGIAISSFLPVFFAALFSRFTSKIPMYALLLLNGIVYGFSCVLLFRLMPDDPLIVRSFLLLSQSCSILLVLFITGTHLRLNLYKFKKVCRISMLSIGIICVLHYLLLLKCSLF